MMKKLTALLTALFLLLSATALADEVIHIGIIQFAEHGSLDNCRIGFIEGLAEEGFVEGENVVFDVQNAQADTAISAQIADVMAGKYDMICAIATPAAMAAFNAAEDAGIPVIYTAVSDPVSAMLAGADGKNPGNITGTSDALPVEAQLKLIRALMPDATKIGILHTTSETNSDATLALYKELAPNYGFEIIDKGISTGADLPMALDALLPQVDCTTNLTDNTVVSYLAVVLEKSEEYGKPVFGSEIEQVINHFGGVNESLVMERDGKLIALVKFDDNVLNWDQATEDKFFENLQAKKKAVLDYVNKHVGKSSKVNTVEVVKDNFEKTATQKIRRFKYTGAQGDEPKETETPTTETKESSDSKDK